MERKTQEKPIGDFEYTKFYDLCEGNFHYVLKYSVFRIFFNTRIVISYYYLKKKKHLSTSKSSVGESQMITETILILAKSELQLTKTKITK